MEDFVSGHRYIILCLSQDQSATRCANTEYQGALKEVCGENGNNG